MATLSRFERLFPRSAPEGTWDNDCEAIDAERAQEMPPTSLRDKGFDYCFPQATLATGQVQDWLANASLPDDLDSPLALAAEFLRDELDRHQDTDAAAALREITFRYVEDNDELFWEEEKSPDAIERLSDCDFRALAWYFQPAFTQALDVQALSATPLP